MKIAVASQTKTQVTGHTGRCQRFWIYDVEAGEVRSKDLLELTKAQSFHASSPLAAHPLDGIQVLIGGGFGKGLARRLERMGIEGIATAETDLDRAVQGYLDGSLPREDPEHHHQDPNAAQACHCANEA
jgi:predicted Fe-Mo cluster-binding NifX family protein